MDEALSSIIGAVGFRPWVAFFRNYQSVGERIPCNLQMLEDGRITQRGVNAQPGRFLVRLIQVVLGSLLFPIPPRKNPTSRNGRSQLSIRPTRNKNIPDSLPLFPISSGPGHFVSIEIFSLPWINQSIVPESGIQTSLGRNVT